MLILNRTPGEQVVLDYPGGIRVVIDVLSRDRGQVRLGFTAPAEVMIWRGELMGPPRPREVPSAEAR